MSDDKKGKRGKQKGGKQKRKQSAPGESIVLGIKGFGLTIPLQFIVQFFFAERAARFASLSALAGSAQRKIAAGKTPSFEEGYALGEVMGPEFREEMRVLRIAAKAQEFYALESQLLTAGEAAEAPPTEPSRAWLDRFRLNAGPDSESDVEEMWAKILAGEVRTPGRFSFKTLSVLRDIGTSTAEVFVRLARYRIDSAPGGVPPWPRFEKRYVVGDISYTALLDLADSGLVSFQESTIGERGGREPLLVSVRGTIARLKSVWGGTGLPVYPLTRAGEELAGIVDAAPSADQLEDIRLWLASHTPELEVAIPASSNAPEETLEFRPWTVGAIFLLETGGPRFAPTELGAEDGVHQQLESTDR